MYVGHNVASINRAYLRGVQHAWDFPVSSFTLSCVETPQTTEGCALPHRSARETCREVERRFDALGGSFDTAIFGCGAYGPPLINSLRKRYPRRNLVYLGSDCLRMFGIYSRGGMPRGGVPGAVPGRWLEVLEGRPRGAERHPEPKYWRT